MTRTMYITLIVTFFSPQTSKVGVARRGPQIQSTREGYRKRSKSGKVLTQFQSIRLHDLYAWLACYHRETTPGDDKLYLHARCPATTPNIDPVHTASSLLRDRSVVANT